MQCIYFRYLIEYSILILKKNIQNYFISTINIISYKYGDNLNRLFDLLSLSQLYRLNKLEEIFVNN